MPLDRWATSPAWKTISPWYLDAMISHPDLVTHLIIDAADTVG